MPGYTHGKAALVTVASAVLMAAVLFSQTGGAASADLAPNVTRYLAFQIFTGGIDSNELRQNFPPAAEEIRKSVNNLRDKIGFTGSESRRLGFVVGPVSFDNTDDDVRRLISTSFDIALETDIAAGFHLDDSMFWGRLQDLNTVDNIEWLDWDRTPNTGRRLDWSSTPTKIRPQLCINSKAVMEAVSRRAELIGMEVAKGIHKLDVANKGYLFLGVIAGWETQIGRDFETGQYLGYCALTNKGFSSANPPPDLDIARSELIKEFAGLWARSLVTSGVPRGKVYSHIAFMSEAVYKMARRMNPSQFTAPYLQTINWTPPEVAFCSGCVPGFSTYPQPGHLEQWQEELKKQGNPAWASSEGTAMDPSEAERDGKGMGMEGYLGNLFNHGAQLVTLFGWGIGPPDNPFRRTAEVDSALMAYRKFLRGEQLAEAPLPAPQIPPADLPDKIQRIQRELPAYLAIHGPALVAPLMERLESFLKKQQFAEAAETADEILRLIAN